jgi:phage terminase small subunit
VAKKKKLPLLQERFCQEYIVDGNATRAYKDAGFRDSHPRHAASKLLANHNVKARIAHLTKLRAARTRVTADKALLRVARLAFANIDDVLTFNGDTVVLRDSKTLSRSKLYGVQSVRKTKDGVALTMESRRAALDTLTKLLGMQNMSPEEVQDLLTAAILYPGQKPEGEG